MRNWIKQYSDERIDKYPLLNILIMYFTRWFSLNEELPLWRNQFKSSFLYKRVGNDTVLWARQNLKHWKETLSWNIHFINKIMNNKIPWFSHLFNGFYYNLCEKFPSTFFVSTILLPFYKSSVKDGSKTQLFYDTFQGGITF